MTPATLEEIRRRLRRFADLETVATSPLYSHLAGNAADDDEIAGLLTATEMPSASPTLLFAAVHRVLQAEPFHELTNYYPSLGGSYGPDGGTWPLFRTFVLDRADRVRDLVATRITQTNEVRRAALLYPAVAIAAKQAGKPVGLLEVGTSAGLLLGMDTYAYRYQTQQAGQLAAGPARSTVGLHCALALAPGATLPSIPKKIATAAKIGLDPNPVDLTDEEQYAWLEACIWPDQPERLRLFGAAAAAQRKLPPELVAGDAVEDLGAVAARIPVEVPLVVLTCSVLWLFDTERRAAFLAALDAVAASRPLWWVSQEGYRASLEPLLPNRDDLRPGEGEAPFGTLGLVRWADGSPVASALAKTAPHGERMEWIV
ncbi:MAG: DUF2332 family protein [Actinophytocola sp.]|uniref:DUF2332 domain-containing protein n=1 Tax=Actinophytocola sp. TaxID=1872138 RepID=UPI0013246EBD|nr:DUF2332 domain-containing protein [Actinophytocola sp.]MPZ82865.1 DUF2332 family protein [Actinophytocola sp.]